MEKRPRRGRLVAALAATAALAVGLPVSGALAGGGDDPDARGAAAPAQLDVQDRGQEREPRGDRDRRDCPKDKQGGSEGSSSSQAPDESTQL